jgi:hypothetical protein
MIEVLLCHAREDTGVADTIASRLELCSEARVWREEVSAEPDSTIASVFGGDQPYSAIILLLSPYAVPQTATRDAWEPVLKHLSSGMEPPIASVVVRHCTFPPLLERKNRYDWKEQESVLRRLQEWVLNLEAGQPPRAFSPARLLWTVPPEREVEQLLRLLVDEPGTAMLSGAQAMRVAQEFAYETGAFFRDVIWIGCGDRSLEFIAGELACKLGTPARDSVENTFQASAATLAAHRLLLVLLEAPHELSRLKLPEGMGSVLITCASREANSEWRLPRIDAGPVDIRWSDWPMTDEEQNLLEAAAVCSPFGFPRDLVLTIAGVPHARADAFGGLISRGFIDPLDKTHLRLNAAEAYEPPDRLRAAHAHALKAAFANSRRNSAQRNDYMRELETALDWALDDDWSLGTQLAIHSGRFLREQNRLLEASWVFRRLQQAAEANEDDDTEDMCLFELRFLPGSEGQQYASRRSVGEPAQMGFEF